MRTFTVAERRNRLARRHFLAPETATEPITRIPASLIGLHATHPAEVQVQLLEDPGHQAQDALARRARELTEWLNGVQVPPRFPSPLMKAATRSG